jgi:hypothetical protein
LADYLDPYSGPPADPEITDEEYERQRAKYIKARQQFRKDFADQIDEPEEEKAEDAGTVVIADHTADPIEVVARLRGKDPKDLEHLRGLTAEQLQERIEHRRARLPVD